MQCKVLTGRQHHRVPGVVAALITHYPLRAAAEQVGGFAFALVAPLGADQDDCRHGVSPAYRGQAGDTLADPTGFAEEPGKSSDV
jgi:hypothetical protein